ncbi:MAG: exodeoxyribonuclease-3, partial [Limisphaerales bacterium]
YPTEQAFSWWDYRGGAFHRKQGLRIDFVLGTPATLDPLSDVIIDREFRKKQAGLTASDHAPVYADINL